MARAFGGLDLALAVFVLFDVTKTNLFITGYKPSAQMSRSTAMRNEYIEKNMEEGSYPKRLWHPNRLERLTQTFEQRVRCHSKGGQHPHIHRNGHRDCLALPLLHTVVVD